MTGVCGLTDLFEECEWEEVLRGLGAGGDAQSPHALEALVALVRREVRRALDRDLAECLAELGGAGAASPRDSQCGSVRIDSTSAGSSVRSSLLSPSKSKSSERLAADMLAARLAADMLQRDTGPKGAEAEQSRLLDGLRELSTEVARWDSVWKEEAELRAEGDQEVERRILDQAGQRFDAVEAQVAEMSSSLQALARIQVELGDEAKLRQETDARLHAFLRDFRSHVVAELEEVGSGHRELGAIVENMHGLISQVTELLGAQSPPALELARPPALAPVNVPALTDLASA